MHARARRLNRHGEVRCPSHVQQLRRPVLCSGRTTSVEHVTTQLKTVTYVSVYPLTLGDIYVGLPLIALFGRFYRARLCIARIVSICLFVRLSVTRHGM